MTEQDILQLRDLAEAGQVQFKERIVNKDDKYEIGCEMVAFSNSRGVRRALEYDPNAIFSNGVDQREITHSTNEFVITIPRKSEQVTNQGNLVTDPAQTKNDPVSDLPIGNTDPAQAKTDPVSDQAHGKTDPAQTEIDPVSDQALGKTDPVSEQPTDQTTQKTTQLAHNTDPASLKSEQPTDQTAQIRPSLLTMLTQLPQKVSNLILNYLKNRKT